MGEINEYSTKDYRFFKAEEAEKRFPGSTMYLSMDKKIKPPEFKFGDTEDRYYEENTFRSWLSFAKKQFLRTIK